MYKTHSNTYLSYLQAHNFVSTYACLYTQIYITYWFSGITTRNYPVYWAPLGVLGHINHNNILHKNLEDTGKFCCGFVTAECWRYWYYNCRQVLHRIQMHSSSMQRLLLQAGCKEPSSDIQAQLPTLRLLWHVLLRHLGRQKRGRTPSAVPLTL